jgi:two-component system OmpR family response regulator
VARAHAILRRTNGDASDGNGKLRFSDVVLDEDTHEVWRADHVIQLTATEFNLLRFFMVNPRRVLSKAQIIDNVWHYDFDGDYGIVETYVSYLRRKLDEHGQPLLQTIRLVGYALRDAEEGP